MVWSSSDSRTACWPIFATALVYVATTVILIALLGFVRLTSPLDHALADRIEQASTARATSGRLLRDFTPAWDRVCLFGGDATRPAG
jgi:hypothetical protein